MWLSSIVYDMIFGLVLRHRDQYLALDGSVISLFKLCWVTELHELSNFFSFGRFCYWAKMWIKCVVKKSEVTKKIWGKIIGCS